MVFKFLWNSLFSQQGSIPSRKKNNRNIGGLLGVPRVILQKQNLAVCVNDTLLGYFNCSGVHGMRYLGEESRPWFERLWWLSAILLSLMIGTFLILRVWLQWRDSPVLVSFADKPINMYDVPIPAVTMCSSTKYRRKAFNFKKARKYNRKRLSPKKKKIFDDIMLLCRTTSEHPYFDDPDFEHFTNESTLDNLNKVAYKDEAVDCMYKGKQPCDLTLNTMITTEGVCFTYNLLHPKLLFKPAVSQYYQESNISSREIWSLTRGYSEDATISDIPFRAYGTGLEAAKAIGLFTSNLNQDYFCDNTKGYKVSLTVPSDMPQMIDYFLLPANGLTFMAIEPHLIDTSESLSNYAPGKRHCFFSSERHLAYFATYSQNNCDFECLTNYTLDMCGCVGFHMPRNITTPICGLGLSNCVIRAKASLDTKLKQERLEHVYSDNSCNCLPSCISLHYTAEITQGMLDVEELLSANKENNTRHVSMNLLFIYFKRMEFTSIQRGELYSYIDLIANWGGILGLCCGISALSFVELFYHVSLRLWNSANRKLKTPLHIDMKHNQTQEGSRNEYHTTSKC